MSIAVSDAEKTSQDLLHDAHPTSHRRHHHYNPFLGITFQATYHVLLRIICLSTLIVQSAILDFYMIYSRTTTSGISGSFPTALFLPLFCTRACVRTNTSSLDRPRTNRRGWGDTPENCLWRMSRGFCTRGFFVARSGFCTKRRIGLPPYSFPNSISLGRICWRQPSRCLASSSTSLFYRVMMQRDVPVS